MKRIDQIKKTIAADQRLVERTKKQIDAGTNDLERDQQFIDMIQGIIDHNKDRLEQLEQK